MILVSELEKNQYGKIIINKGKNEVSDDDFAELKKNSVFIKHLERGYIAHAQVKAVTPAVDDNERTELFVQAKALGLNMPPKTKAETLKKKELQKLSQIKSAQTAKPTLWGGVGFILLQ